MQRLRITRSLISLGCYLTLALTTCIARAGSPASKQDSAELKFVVILSRHGVRSPTDDYGKYDAYSSAPWPRWNVRPGYLTAHGFELMKRFGAFDRAHFAENGLFTPSGCADASRVTILADSDERTRESGKALAEGMFPGCQVAVEARPERDPDPLFHTMRAGMGTPDRALAAATIEGSAGGDTRNLTAAYRPQLDALDRILAGCGHAAPTNPNRISVFEALPAQIKSSGDHPEKTHSPVAAASSMAESLLLEYAEGFADSDLGWGCLDENKLDEIMQLHEAHAEYSERVPVIARMEASNLLHHILASLEQSAAGKPKLGASARVSDHALFLVGHDTNIATLAGMLDLHWIVDGRRDDTPPGGALVFELWRKAGGTYCVRVYYMAQTLRQMRETQTLTTANPPQRLPVFVPGCSRADMSCTLHGFAEATRRAIDPDFIAGNQQSFRDRPGDGSFRSRTVDSTLPKQRAEVVRAEVAVQ